MTEVIEFMKNNTDALISKEKQELSVSTNHTNLSNRGYIFDELIGKKLINDILSKQCSDPTVTLYDIAKEINFAPGSVIGKWDIISDQVLTINNKLFSDTNKQTKENINIYQGLVDLVGDCMDLPISGIGSSHVDSTVIHNNCKYISLIGIVVNEFANSIE